MDPYGTHLLRHFERKAPCEPADRALTLDDDFEPTGVLTAQIEYVSVSISRDEDGGEEHPIDMSWGFGTSQASVLRAISERVCTLHGERELCGELNRALAGVYAVVTHDRALSVNWPGTFWDRDAWTRVGAYAGLTMSGRADREAIARIKALLMRSRFHVRGYGSHRRKVAEVHFSSLLVEPRLARLALDWGEGEHEFRAYSIPKPLLDQLDRLPGESALFRMGGEDA